MQLINNKYRKLADKTSVRKVWVLELCLFKVVQFSYTLIENVPTFLLIKNDV